MKYLLPVITVTDKDHAKILTLYLHFRQSIQNDSDTLIPHHSAHEQIYRNVAGKIVCPGNRIHLVGTGSFSGKINTIGHDNIVTLVAQSTQIFTGSLTHCPDFIAGADVGEQHLFADLL